MRLNHVVVSVAVAVAAVLVFALAAPVAGAILFLPPVHHEVVDDPYSLEAGDLDGDGDADLATGESSSTFSILLGDGLGGFAPWARYVGGGESLALGDIDEDGDLDVVIGDDLGGCQKSLGNGDGTFTLGKHIHLSQAPTQLTLADVSGDGHLDLLSVGREAGAAGVLLGAGDGTFGTPADYATSLGWSPLLSGMWTATATSTSRRPTPRPRA